MGADLDLATYLNRVGLSTRPRADLGGLRTLHLAHATHIPFENLDVQMGLPIHLDLGSLQGKLVKQNRGGYCFEQNTLFHAVLAEMGFDAIACEARVRMGTQSLLPRTHMLLLVTLEGVLWLCDVGFGGEGLLWPVCLDGAIWPQFQNSYRVAQEGPLRVLQSLRGESWNDLYAFLPEPRYPVDFEMANHYTSTHPESRFVKTLTAQLAGPQVRRILRDRTYLEIRGEHTETRELAVSEVIPMLRDSFGIDVPEGATFRVLSSQRAAETTTQASESHPAKTRR